MRIEDIDLNGRLSDDELAFLENEVSKLSRAEQATKVVLNGGYGAIGNTAFRHFDVDIAEAITSTGRVAIKRIGKNINEFTNEHGGTSQDVDNCFSSDTDSNYTDITNIVHRLNLIDEDDINKTVDNIVKFDDELMSPLIDRSFDELAEYLNMVENTFDMKREIIGRNALIRAKKNYIIQALDNEGVRYAKPFYKMMGVETQRTSTPMMVREYLNKAFQIISSGTLQELRDLEQEFKEIFLNSPLEKIASPRGISDIDKYSNADYTAISGVTIPIHVRASINYNVLVKELKLLNKYPYIKNSNKIKFIPLKKPNPIKSHVIGFIDELPKEFGLDDYIDRELQYEKIFINPINSFMIFNMWKLEETGLDNLFDDFTEKYVHRAEKTNHKKVLKDIVEAEDLF